MVNTCFVPTCRTGYKPRKTDKTVLQKRSLFSTPKDPVLFSLWQKAIPRADRKLTHKDYVCELHFREEDVDNEYRLKLFDGSMFRYRKGRKTLKPGAIPLIFLNVPGYDNSMIKKKFSKKKYSTKKVIQNKVSEDLEKSNKIGNEEKKGKENFDKSVNQLPQIVVKTYSAATPQNFSQDLSRVAHVFSEDDSCHYEDNVAEQGSTDPETEEPDVYLPQSVIEEEFSFRFIKTNIDMIERDNSWWAVNVFDDFIICARWNTDFIVERKIVIKEDLTVKVFLLEKETTIGDDLKMVSIENISKLIYRVERTLICPGIFDNEGKCHGFLQGTHKCRKWNLCEGCILWEKVRPQLEKWQLRDEKKKNENIVELMRFEVTS